MGQRFSGVQGRPMGAVMTLQQPQRMGRDHLHHIPLQCRFTNINNNIITPATPTTHTLLSTTPTGNNNNISRERVSPTRTITCPTPSGKSGPELPTRYCPLSGPCDNSTSFARKSAHGLYQNKCSCDLKIFSKAA